MKMKYLLIGAVISATLSLSPAFGQTNSSTMYNGAGNISGFSGSYYGDQVNASGLLSFAGGKSSTAFGAYSQAFGFLSNTGNGASYSFAQGYSIDVTGAYSVAMGVRNKATNSHTFAFGIDLQATGNRSMIFGSGVTNGPGIGTDIVNNIPSSLMIGFNSNKPTLFIGPSNGLNTTGNVGIGTTTPKEDLEVIGTAAFSEAVGIGRESSASAKLTIFSNTSSSGIVVETTDPSVSAVDVNSNRGGVHATVGLTNFSNLPPTTTAISGISSGSTNQSYGILGVAMATANSNYGVYGQAENGGFNYGVFGSVNSSNAIAGYFNGDVFSTTGMYLGSDRKLKDNVKPLTDADKLMLLQPKEYIYRVGEFGDMNLAEGEQMGFIAQELEEVYPNLVRTTVQPPKVDDDGNIISEGTTFKAVNYIGLIPVLTSAVQDQNSIIKKQEMLIDELFEKVDRLEKLAGVNNENDPTEVVLFQNTPNPFSEQTVIRYSLPERVRAAEIMIFNLNGHHEMTIEIEKSVNGNVVLDANTLQPGMYVYALIVDGKELAKKKMIITK